MTRRNSRDERAAFVSIFTLLALPFVLLAWLFGGGRDIQLTHVRIGVGGKLRRATADEWLSNIDPLKNIGARAESLLQQKASAIVRASVADDLEQACDRAESTNFVFDTKRAARQFRAIIDRCRKLVDALRSGQAVIVAE